MLSPASREAESQVCEAGDLVLVVDPEIEAASGSVFGSIDTPLSGKEVATAHLAQHENIGSRRQAGTIRGQRFETGDGPGRTQTGKGVELHAQAHETVLHVGIPGHPDIIPLRSSRGTDEDGIGLLRPFECLFSQKGSVSLPGGSVQKVLRDVDAYIPVTGLFDNPERTFRHFRADAVSPQGEKFEGRRHG